MAAIPDIPNFDASSTPDAPVEIKSAALSPADQAMLNKISKLSSYRSDNIVSEPTPVKKSVRVAAKNLDNGLDAMAADDGLMEDRRAAARKLQEQLETDPAFAARYRQRQAVLAEQERLGSINDELVDEDDLASDDEPVDDPRMEAMTLALEKLGKACVLIQTVKVMHVHIHK